MLLFSTCTSFFAGFALGLIYFGGLWLTVRRLSNSNALALWLLFSFVLRMAILLGGIWLVAGGLWERLLFAVAGVVVSRTALVYRLQAAPDLDKQPAT